MISEEGNWTELLRDRTPVRAHFAFEELESTNQTARILLQRTLDKRVLDKRALAKQARETGNDAEDSEKNSPALPFLVTAQRQTAGRGRGDHRWWSPQGGLFLTAAAFWRDFGLTREESVELSLRAARSTAQTIRETLSQRTDSAENDFSQRVRIKPPNDIYIDGKKSAGILIESPSAETLLVGIGINLNNQAKDAPEEIRQNIVSLCDLTGERIDTAEFIIRLMQNLFRK